MVKFDDRSKGAGANTPLTGGETAMTADDEAMLLEEIRERLIRPGAGMAPLPPGTTIAAFRIVRRLGAGGMGVVYEAHRIGCPGRVALKVLRAMPSAPQSRRRFEHEAEILRRLDHPGIARLYEAGTVETDEGPQPYFAMELVDGRPLPDFARALPRRARLNLVAALCDAVHHAHTRGVIHRDLKPSNVLVDGGVRPRVLDFGVARLTDSDLRTTTLRTDVGQLVGTLPYMSPEQMIATRRGSTRAPMSMRSG